MDNYYIYCIAHNAPEGLYPDVAGHGDAPVLGVRYREMTAIVSKTEQTHIDAGYENLQRHEAIISRIMRDYDLLPMSFSTICESYEGVASILEKYYGQFRENLDRVSGRIELGVKVFFRFGANAEEPPKERAASSPREYMMNLYGKYEQRKKAEEELFSVIETFHEKLLGIAADCRYTKPMKNNLVFNASYLVEKGRKNEFDTAIEEITAEYPAFRINYSSPWPAYHFIKIVREVDEDERL